MPGTPEPDEMTTVPLEQPSRTEASSRKPPPRLDYLDALRGVAVLGVIAVHTLQNFATNFGSSVLAMGMWGVALFYMVSAFSLSLSLDHRALREGNTIRNYAIRRIFRIAPAFYLAVAFFLLRPFILPISAMPRDVLELPWKPNLSDIIQTLLFVNGWSYRAINLVVPGGWSVAVETNFYLVLPFLIRYTTTIKRALLVFLGTVIGARVISKALYLVVVPHLAPEALHAVGIFNGMWLPTQLPVFALGILWFVYHRQTQQHNPVRRRKQTLMLAAGALVAVTLTALLPPTFEKILPFYIRIAIAMLFGCALLAQRPTRLVVNRFTIFVGKLSYSAYLFHMVAIQLLLWFSHAFFEPAFGVAPSFYLAFPVITALTCAIAFVTYKYVELPGQDWGRRWIKRLDRNQSKKRAAALEKMEAIG